MIIAENLAKTNGGRYLQARYMEIIEPRKEETRTPEEIIINIKNRLKRL